MNSVERQGAIERFEASGQACAGFQPTVADVVAITRGARRSTTEVALVCDVAAGGVWLENKPWVAA